MSNELTLKFTGEQAELILAQILIQYDYMDDAERLEVKTFFETNKLEPKDYLKSFNYQNY